MTALTLTFTGFFAMASTSLYSVAQESPLKASIEIKTESSNNALAQSQKVDSLGTSVSPSIEYNTEVTKNLFLQSSLSGSVKQYDKKIVDDSAKNQNVELALGSSRFFLRRHEVGATIARKISNGREVDYVSTGFSAAGRESKFEQSYGDLYYAFLNPWGYVEVLGSFANREYQTKTKDEELNEYFDSFTQRGVALELNYDISPSLKSKTRAFLNERDYSERPAKNTDGGNDTSNPLLKENHQGLSTGLEYEVFGRKLELQVNIAKERDLILGAEDADVLGGQIKIEIPFSSKLKLKSEAASSEQKFLNFAADPNNRATAERKVNSSISTKLGLEYVINKYTLSLDLSDFQQSSNYKVSGAKYSEQKIAAGFKAEL